MQNLRINMTILMACLFITSKSSFLKNEQNKNLHKLAYALEQLSTKFDTQQQKVKPEVPPQEEKPPFTKPPETKPVIEPLEEEEIVEKEHEKEPSQQAITPQKTKEKEQIEVEKPQPQEGLTLPKQITIGGVGPIKVSKIQSSFKKFKKNKEYKIDTSKNNDDPDTDLRIAPAHFMRQKDLFPLGSAWRQM